MDTVRPITIIGLALGVIALFLIPYSLPLAIVCGVLGIVISIRNLMTTK